MKEKKDYNPGGWEIKVGKLKSKIQVYKVTPP